MNHISKILKKWWTLGPILLCPIIGLLSFWGNFQDIGRPFPGFHITRSISTGRYYPDMSSHNWQYAEADINSQTILVLVEGKSFGPSYIRSFEQAFFNGSGSVQITICHTSDCLQDIDRFGKTVSLPLTRYTWTNFFEQRLPMVLCGLILFLLSIVTFKFGQNWAYYRSLILGFTIGAQFCWGANPTLFVDENLLGRILDAWLWIVLLPFIGATVTHFAFLYPTPSIFYFRRLPGVLYGLASAITIIYGVARLGWWFAPQASWYRPMDRLGFEGGYLYMALGFLIVVTRLTFTYSRRHRSGWIGRSILPILLTAPFVAIILLTELTRVLGSPGFSNTSTFVVGNFDQRYFILPIVAAFTYNMLRFEYDRRSLPLLNLIMVLASAVVLADMLKVLEIVLQQFLNLALSIQTLVFLSGFIILIIALMIASLFQASLQKFMGRHTFVVIQQFGQKIAGHAQPLALSEAIVRACLDEMEVGSAALWLLKSEQPLDQELYLQAYAGAPGGKPYSCLPFEPFKQLRTTLRFDQNKHLAIWPGNSMVTLTPMIVTGKLIGLLGLGKRLDEQVFDYTDLEVIEKAAQEASSLLTNALTLQQIPMLVLQAQEFERRKIAQELHDTTQQFLARMQFLLEISLQTIHKAPEQSVDQLEKLIQDTSQAAQALREIRTNLAPVFLEIGLQQPLVALIHQFERNTHVQANLQLSDNLDARLTIQSRHVLYRIVQQALDNVAAHAQASQVLVNIITDELRVNIEITDDGRGFTAEQRQQSQAGGSFGLISMESRAKMLGGELHIQASPGNGTQISGWLPISN
jgi:signal transduction histidine kinase